MSWSDAGAFVWHTDAIDPAVLGQELRTHGFGWAAIFVQDGATTSPPDPAWTDRFRQASGLPLGGWGVLRSDPVHEAETAHDLIRRYGLDFYIADAEAEYGYTAANGASGARYARSQSFVAVTRSAPPPRRRRPRLARDAAHRAVRRLRARRYLVLVFRSGLGEAAEEILFSDVPILIAIAAWSVAAGLLLTLKLTAPPGWCGA